ncbi:TIGR03087 family PEP-CTERM/XrtA system glycosyltransferase [Sphingomonas lenta]|uniref:TIGR03087 family PEP-CTERM/XrtA system glycosyltransferase n=1 Tax=Sphingomonas lenta TaxID=1141887 RepID=UPI001FEB7CE0|nr:TIGR03087 family PEP-CTERM/XrtA system glycosyltransferase [Sphingomonas lenta]
MSDLLFLAHRAPFPPDRGDKIRSFHVLRHLAERARVHLVAFGEGETDREPTRELAERLASWTIVPRVKSRGRALAEALATGRPVSLTVFADRRLAAAVERVRREHAVATTYAFSGQMAQYASGRIIMDFVDVDSAKFAQMAERARGPMRWVLRREARLLGGYERAVAERAEASLFVTDAEAALFRAGGGGGKVLAVENGIDSRLFDPAAVEPVRRAGPLIVFTGQMDYPPNIEAVAWFAERVLPTVRARHPDATFAIVGRAPTTRVRALAGEGVLVTGEVPDVRPWLAAANVVVAPLRLARGVQNKVLEAMAMARPVLASPAAAEGIDHAGTLRFADEDFAGAVCDLLGDRAAAEALGTQARAQVIARYGWDARLAPLDTLLGLAEPVRWAA